MLIEPGGEVGEHFFAAEVVQGLVEHARVNQQGLVGRAQAIEELGATPHLLSDSDLTSGELSNFTWPKRLAKAR